jgi:hypothetical protein
MSNAVGIVVVLPRRAYRAVPLLVVVGRIVVVVQIFSFDAPFAVDSPELVCVIPVRAYFARQVIPSVPIHVNILSSRTIDAIVTIRVGLVPALGARGASSGLRKFKFGPEFSRFAQIWARSFQF